MHFPCGEVRGNLKRFYKNNKFYLRETEIYNSFKRDSHFQGAEGGSLMLADSVSCMTRHARSNATGYISSFDVI